MQTHVKERGEKFTGEEVRAILAVRKSMFRRVVKNPRNSPVDIHQAEWVEPYANAMGHTGCWSFYRAVNDIPMPKRRWAFNRIAIDTLKCHYEPGMRLWVRETFIIESFGAGVAQIRYEADNARGNNAGVSDRKLPDRCGKVSSMRMPRHCSRITLEVTDVRCSRLRTMTEDDAVAEGCEGISCCRHPQYGIVTEDGVLPSEQFEQLWDSINACRGYSWESNPLVWAVSFKRLENSNAIQS